MTSHFDEPERRGERIERIERVDLGDLVGDDERLRAALPGMDARLNDDAPGTQVKRTLDLLAIVKLPILKAVSVVKKTAAWVADRLLDREIRRARAKKIEAEAGVEEAKAEKVRAEAHAIEAQAMKTATETVVLERESQMEYLARLKKLGIDFRAELAEDGTLKVVVTKRLPKKGRGKGKGR